MSSAGTLCLRTLPRASLPAAAQAETTHGKVMFLTRGAWCLCLLFNEEETFQSVARLSYETRIFIP